MAIYDSIGKDYNSTRHADERIVKRLISLLNCPKDSLIVDIGAGTGNYSHELAEHFRSVYALEPSEVMIRQGKKHGHLKWFRGSAENTLFHDDLFDGAVCILASHHFSSLDKAFREICRILKPGSNLVMLTFDLRNTGDNDWIKDYFSPFHQKASLSTPEQRDIEALLKIIFKGKVEAAPFKLPPDLSDGFFYSAWKYPEKYLDADFRKGISAFSTADQQTIDSAVGRLHTDLQNGIWDKKYRNIRESDEFDGGYYFIKSGKNL